MYPNRTGTKEREEEVGRDGLESYQIGLKTLDFQLFVPLRCGCTYSWISKGGVSPLCHVPSM